MRTQLIFSIVLLIIATLLSPLVAIAQSDGETVVVHAVLFYSPTCPHCHAVITELLAPMMNEYGKRLQITGIDTSQPGGAQLYRNAIQRYQIPEARRGVPTLVIDDVVLVGSGEIPDRFPGLVEAGLAGEGIAWPDFSGLAELVAGIEQGPGLAPTASPTAQSLISTATANPEIGDGVCRPDQENCEEPGASTGFGTPAPQVFGPSLAPVVKAELTGDGIVRLVFIWAEDCRHCHEVLENVLPPLEKRYGDRLEIVAIETSKNTSDYEIYLAAIETFNVAPERQGWPAIFIGDTHLLGSIEIPDRLEGLIEAYLDQGGVAYPPIPGLDAAIGKPPEVKIAEDETPSAETKPIYLAYFYQTGCQDCDRVQGDLNYLKSKYPQLIVEEFNVRDSAELSEWLGEQAGVPTDRRLTAPTVFVGDDYLLEEDLDARSLEALLAKHALDGAEHAWKNWKATAGKVAQESIVERFKSLGAFTVVFAGLVDGLNPCAFATLVFFVSYLTISGRKGREVLTVGAAFTIGVFLAYVLVGIGFYRALDLLGDALTTLGRWLYGLTAAFCLVLAVVSFRDYLKARRGEIGDMALNLPHRLRMQINATIRKTRKSQAFVAAAFVTGVVVSFLELACTGQVYLPTIIFVMSVPELKAQATAFLLLYNVLFVAPLVVVFILAYYGTGAKLFSNFLQQRASTVKLGMSLLFLTLGGWLAVSLI